MRTMALSDAGYALYHGATPTGLATQSLSCTSAAMRLRADSANALSGCGIVHAEEIGAFDAI